MRKKRINPDKPLRELQRCINKLREEQGPVARRNARGAVLAELRRVRAWLDATYPNLQTKQTRKNRQSKRKALDGWKPTIGAIEQISLLAAGIPMKIWRQPSKADKKDMIEVKYFPAWAVEMLDHPRCTKSMLQKARRSVAFRKDMLMEEHLRKRGLEETTEKVMRLARKKAPPRISQLQLGQQIHKELERSLP